MKIKQLKKTETKFKQTFPKTQNKISFSVPRIKAQKLKSQQHHHNKNTFLGTNKSKQTSKKKTKQNRTDGRRAAPLPHTPALILPHRRNHGPTETENDCRAATTLGTPPHY